MTRRIALLVIASAVSGGAAVAQPIVDFDEAEEQKSDFWERALEPGADQYGGLIEKASTLLRESDRESTRSAAELLADAVRLAPDRPEAHLWLGRLRDREGDHAACAQSLGRALALDPHVAAPGGDQPPEIAAPYELAVCQARAGQYERAVDGLRRLVGAGPVGSQDDRQRALIHQRLAECYMALGRLDDAKESFRQAKRLHPYSSDLDFALAVAHDRDDEEAESRDLLAQALARDPMGNALSGSSRIWIPREDAQYYLGLARLGAGDGPRALFHFRRFLAAAGEKNPWTKRARRHYESAQAEAVAGRGLEIMGSATLDATRAGAAIARSDRALQACLQKAPHVLLRVTITAVVPAGRKKGRTLGLGPDSSHAGVRVLLLEQEGEKSADVRTAVACTENAARAIALPKPTGVPGGYVTAQFTVIAR